jgi:hypothetical protein
VSATALPFLAELRVRHDVRAALVGETAWLYWQVDDNDVLHRVLALGGAEVLECRGGLWFRRGNHLPTFEVPDPAEAQPLVHLLAPAPVVAQRALSIEVQPLTLQLVRDGCARPARALYYALAELAAWVENATSHQLAGLEAAVDADGHALVIGERLPLFSAGERFWGNAVLAPLGWRAEPDVGEAALCEALGLGTTQFGILRAAGLEVVNRGVLRPLTRAGVRLAVLQGGHEK